MVTVFAHFGFKFGFWLVQKLSRRCQTRACFFVKNDANLYLNRNSLKTPNAAYMEVPVLGAKMRATFGWKQSWTLFTENITTLAKAAAAILSITRCFGHARLEIVGRFGFA